MRVIKGVVIRALLPLVASASQEEGIQSTDMLSTVSGPLPTQWMLMEAVFCWLVIITVATIY